MTKRDFVGRINEMMESPVFLQAAAEPLLRAEAAVMLAKLKCLGGKPEVAEKFADGGMIPEHQKGAVGVVAHYGYLTGDSKGRFCPFQELKEEEAAQMLAMANPGRGGARAYTKELKRPAERLDVERLWFRVKDPAFHDRWVELDEQYWTRFLTSWQAVGRKDYWMSQLNPCEFSTLLYGQKSVWEKITLDCRQALDRQYIAEIGTENYQFVRGETKYHVLAYVANELFEPSRCVTTSKLCRPMAVEELEFRLKDPTLVETWVQADHRIWTQSLAQNDGFYRKDVWQSTEDPCVVKTVIYWRTKEDWLSYDHSLLEPLDAEMEMALGERNCELLAAEHEIEQKYQCYKAE